MTGNWGSREVQGNLKQLNGEVQGKYDSNALYEILNILNFYVRVHFKSYLHIWYGLYQHVGLILFIKKLHKNIWKMKNLWTLLRMGIIYFIVMIFCSMMFRLRMQEANDILQSYITTLIFKTSINFSDTSEEKWVLPGHSKIC